MAYPATDFFPRSVTSHSRSPVSLANSMNFQLASFFPQPVCGHITTVRILQIPNLFLPPNHDPQVGVKRLDFASSGQPVPIFVYDHHPLVDHSSLRSGHLALRNLENPSSSHDHGSPPPPPIRRLQSDVAPQILTPRCVYDGRKNISAIRKIPFDTGSQEFNVTLADSTSTASGKGPKVYNVKPTRVAEINPELSIWTFAWNPPLTILLFKIVAATDELRTVDVTNHERKRTSWIRRAMGKMLTNVDISTGTIFKHGRLIRLCLEYICKNDPNALSSKRGLPDRERLRLQRFIPVLPTLDPVGKSSLIA
ncbi:hypothetical protein C8R43DRAFT_946885 [Mycena crocata]|nr:hypothetical protein C8R43DRAFT_946885 [Mycena crocata]